MAQVVVTLKEAKRIERQGGSYVWEIAHGEPTGRCIATLPRDRRSHSGFDCNNTGSPSGDPSPF